MTIENRIEISLEEEQKLLFELLEYILEICRKEDIQMFLGYGSLLGTIRHQGFIPWDDDIDVLMTRDNYIKFCSKMRHNINDKYFFQDYLTDKRYPVPEISRVCLNNTYKWPVGYEQAPFHTGVYIDIFPLDFGEKELDGTLKKMKICAKCHNLLYRKYRRNKLQDGLITYIKVLTQKLIPHSILKSIMLNTIRRHKNGIDTNVMCNYGAAFAGGEKLIYPSDWFSSVVYKDFNGIKVPCPIGYKEFLLKFYGSDYMTPKQTKGKRHVAYRTNN